MRLVGLSGRSQRPVRVGGKRPTSGDERGTLALEFLIILPFLVGLTCEEAATVAVMARQRGLSPEDALRAADEYVESRSQLWSLRQGHCVNASYDETTEEYDMSEAVGAAWWEINDDNPVGESDEYALNRGGAGEPTALSSELADEIWVDYRIGCRCFVLNMANMVFSGNIENCRDPLSQWGKLLSQ